MMDPSIHSGLTEMMRDIQSLIQDEEVRPKNVIMHVKKESDYPSNFKRNLPTYRNILIVTNRRYPAWKDTLGKITSNGKRLFVFQSIVHALVYILKLSCRQSKTKPRNIRNKFSILVDEGVYVDNFRNLRIPDGFFVEIMGMGNVFSRGANEDKI